MSKHKNYNKMYNNPEPVVKVEESVDVVEHIEVETEPVIAPIEQPQFTAGIVVGCSKLNVRTHPNSDANIKCILKASTEVRVDQSAMYDEWYAICTATGIEGYCMKQYIKLV